MSHTGDQSLSSSCSIRSSCFPAFPQRAMPGLVQAMRLNQKRRRGRTQDTLFDLRNEITGNLYDYFNIKCDAHHHEVATAGQCEIDMKYDALTRMADNVLTYKNVVKNVAYNMKMVATFMPNPSL